MGPAAPSRAPAVSWGATWAATCDTGRPFFIIVEFVGVTWVSKHDTGSRHAIPPGCMTRVPPGDSSRSNAMDSCPCPLCSPPPAGNGYTVTGPVSFVSLSPSVLQPMRERNHGVLAFFCPASFNTGQNWGSAPPSPVSHSTLSWSGSHVHVGHGGDPVSGRPQSEAVPSEVPGPVRRVAPRSGRRQSDPLCVCGVPPRGPASVLGLRPRADRPHAGVPAVLSTPPCQRGVAAGLRRPRGCRGPPDVSP